MTEYSSKTLRAAMKAKASRLASGSDATHVGASTFTPAEPLDATVQTGARPLTRRRFKSGGKVVGAANAPRADKKKRGNSALSPDNFINRDVVAANEEREGKKHIGGMARGGRNVSQAANKVIKLAKMYGDDHPSVKAARGEFNTLAGQREANRPMSQEGQIWKGVLEKGQDKSDGMKKGGRAKKAGGGSDLIAKYLKDNPAPMPPKMPADIRASRAAEAANSRAVPERDPSIPTAAEEARMKATSAANTAANAADARLQAEKDRFDAIGQKRGGKAEAKCWGGGTKKASGGRAKKFMGGPMMQPGGMMSAAPQGPSGPIVDKRDEMVNKNRMNFGTGPSGSPYKKGGKVAFEGSAKDEMQDTKLAKKYGMKMAAWEKSKMDKKHDEQGSMEGLKKGGRAARKRGGRTNIEIVIATGKGQQGGMMPDNGGMPPKQPSPAMPVQAPPAAGLPPMAGAGGPPPQMPAGAPPMPAGMDKMMPRKAGGRVYKSYKDMDAGAGSGLGRLEKAEIAERKGHKHGGKTYKSYKDMDAGAASGMGRLEKTEIAKRGR
jgi:hypothetical protein